MEKQAESLSRMMGKRASGSSNLRGASPMNESKSQIAKRCPDLRSSPGAKMRTVFSKDDITDVMRAVLNRPMSPHYVE